MGRVRAIPLLVLALAGLSGCSASIKLRTGRRLEGDIKRSDKDFVYLKPDAVFVWVRRSEIARIDCSGGQCATSALVQLQDGTVLAGKVRTAADAGALQLEVAENDAVRVSRSEIADIDHPGNGILAAGAVFGGVGVAVLGVALKTEPDVSSDSTSTSFTTSIGTGTRNNRFLAAGLILGTGVVLSIAGGIIWGNSSARMNELARRLTLAPLIVPDEVAGTLYGGMVVTHF